MDEKSPGFRISDLASKVTNVDGKILGKDGRPLLARRNVFHYTDMKGSASGIDIKGNDGSASAKEDVHGVHETPKSDASKATVEAASIVKNVDTGSSAENSDGNGKVVKTNEVTEGDKLKPADSVPKMSYAAAVSPEKLATSSGASVDGLKNQKANFRFIDPVHPSHEGVDVQIPLSSVLEANTRFEHTLYGYFLGKRVAFPVVQNYVLNVWKKYGITKAMMNAKGFFFFKFNSAAGMEGVLENGPWFIRSVPIVLKKWTATDSLLKEDLVSVPVWVKLHDVPVAAFTEDGLSAIASNLGIPLMLDSYTSSMCLSSWGRLDFARALIEIRADRELKNTLVISIPSVIDNKVTLHTVKVEYEWKPPRCSSCQVFGHETSLCSKRVANATQQTGPKAGAEKQKDTHGFQQVKRKPFKGLVVGNQKKVTIGNQMYVPKKQTKEVNKTSTSNSFKVLPNDEGNPVADLGKNQGTTSTGDLQKEDRGKKVESSSSGGKSGNSSSLYTQENVDYDSDDDEVFVDYGDEMARFMDAFDRRKR